MIYFYNSDSKYYQFSRELVFDNLENIFVVYKSISEWVSVLSKLGFYNIVDNELDKIVNNFNILYPDTSSLNVFNKLITKYKPKGNKVYDFEIVSIMLSHGISNIVTINVDDFKKIDEIEIITYG